MVIDNFKTSNAFFNLIRYFGSPTEPNNIPYYQSGFLSNEGLLNDVVIEKRDLTYSLLWSKSINDTHITDIPGINENGGFLYSQILMATNDIVTVSGNRVYYNDLTNLPKIENKWKIPVELLIIDARNGDLINDFGYFVSLDESNVIANNSVQISFYDSFILGNKIMTMTSINYYVINNYGMALPQKKTKFLILDIQNYEINEVTIDTQERSISYLGNYGYIESKVVEKENEVYDIILLNQDGNYENNIFREIKSYQIKFPSFDFSLLNSEILDIKCKDDCKVLPFSKDLFVRFYTPHYPNPWVGKITNQIQLYDNGNAKRDWELTINGSMNIYSNGPIYFDGQFIMVSGYNYLKRNDVRPLIVYQNGNASQSKFIEFNVVVPERLENSYNKIINLDLIGKNTFLVLTSTQLQSFLPVLPNTMKSLDVFALFIIKINFSAIYSTEKS